MSCKRSLVLLLLCLSSCAARHHHGSSAPRPEKPKAATIKPPDNTLIFNMPIEAVSENMKNGLDCALKQQPHQTIASDLGQSMEIWVKGAATGDDAATRVQLIAAGNSTVAEIISPAPPGPSIKNLKLYGDTGRCGPSAPKSSSH